MTLVVHKCGGKAVEDISRILDTAGFLQRQIFRGDLKDRNAVVVSAMAGETDRLLRLCRKVPNMPAGERDAVVVSGENVAAGLMAGALCAQGLSACSLQGWQAKILTDGVFGDARVIEVGVKEILRAFAAGDIPVVTGFQGVSTRKRVTALGRGGSDTTAVVLASKLRRHNEPCVVRFYKDELGVCTADPKVVPVAQVIPEISYEEMLEMAGLGSKVLNPRAVQLACPVRGKKGELVRPAIPLHIVSFNDPASPGTLVTENPKTMGGPVTGLSTFTGDALITIENVPNEPGLAAKIFGPITDKGIVVDVIAQADPGSEDPAVVAFTTPKERLGVVRGILERTEQDVNGLSFRIEDDIARITLVGSGMRNAPGVAAKMFATLGELRIPNKIVHSSEISLGFVVPEDHMKKAACALHTAFGLDGPKVPQGYLKQKARNCLKGDLTHDLT